MCCGSAWPFLGTCRSKPLVERADESGGIAEIGLRGETGMGWICSSSSLKNAPLVPGSKNEKKLCNRECLWWWPRFLDVEAADDVEVAKRGPVINSGVGKLQR